MAVHYYCEAARNSPTCGDNKGDFENRFMYTPVLHSMHKLISQAGVWTQHKLAFHADCEPTTL